MSAFERTLKRHLVTYRIVSYHSCSVVCESVCLCVGRTDYPQRFPSMYVRPPKCLFFWARDPSPDRTHGSLESLPQTTWLAQPILQVSPNVSDTHTDRPRNIGHILYCAWRCGLINTVIAIRERKCAENYNK